MTGAPGGAYRGRLRTELLNDEQIRAKEYPRWSQCRSAFTRGKRRQIVDRHKAQIAQHGVPEFPLLLDVSRDTGWVYVGDGHHRAIALMELGIKRFPFVWRYIDNTLFGLGQPKPSRDPFPYHLLGL
ncbi:hypothetical protein [Streptomyces ortus]|uniref:ParB/Sulfiredoxin domain-containing protein n=1 Tax=Streptomyces ortus TaxID=2867268 RepID=A0ABT3V5Z0_9ACTN|nr:hypothetical protein [Streptomyces ortus]MCX4235407.1 hypothetical protein [Streptomyces ortus]